MTPPAPQRSYSTCRISYEVGTKENEEPSERPNNDNYKQNHRLGTLQTTVETPIDKTTTGFSFSPVKSMVHIKWLRPENVQKNEFSGPQVEIGKFFIFSINFNISAVGPLKSTV